MGMIKFEWLEHTVAVHADSMEELTKELVNFENRWPNMKLKLSSVGETVDSGAVAVYWMEN